MRSIAGVSNDNGTAQQHHSTQVSKLLTWLIQVWDDTTKNRSDCAGRRQTELRSLNAVCYPHKNRYEFLRSYVTENRQLLRQRRTTCEGLQCANATPHPQYRYWTPTAHKRADLYHHRAIQLYKWHQPGSANLGPRQIAGCCHLANWTARSQSQCPSIVNVSWR